MDYKYGNKNNWRRWQWNRIAERVPDRANAVVLYLAGEADLDRKIALERGFRDHNLIAIEKDGRTLSTLRSKGVLAIHGDLVEIIDAWPHDRRVDVVVGDFCCGLEAKLLCLAKAWLLPPFFQATFAFNFLRGRDPSTNELRKASGISEMVGQGYGKHRGLMFLRIATNYVLEDGLDGVPRNEVQAILNVVADVCAPASWSYQSSANQVFDSIIYRSPAIAGDFNNTDYEDDADYRDFVRERKRTPTRRQISAILAHQTMRGNGITRA